MGFDLYGEEPKNNTELPKWIHEYQDDEGWANWEKIEKDDKKDEYFAATNKNEEENPGVYFRNNVWWWRPLWSYACDICEPHLSDKDLAAGDYNDGYIIDKQTAALMAVSLTTAEHDGSLDIYVKMYNKQFDEARANNKEVDKLKEELRQTVIKDTGNKDTYPALYEGKHKRLYERLTEKENWGGHYPFHKENAIAFRKFVEESGGFRIC